MANVNKRIFSFLYPIVLLHTPFDEEVDNQDYTCHQLAYMKLLNDHFMNHSHENHDRRQYHDSHDHHKVSLMAKYQFPIQSDD